MSVKADEPLIRGLREEFRNTYQKVWHKLWTPSPTVKKVIRMYKKGLKRAKS